MYCDWDTQMYFPLWFFHHNGYIQSASVKLHSSWSQPKKLSYSSENVSADMLNGALPWEQHAERGQSCPLFESVQRNTILSGFMNRIHTSSLILQLWSTSSSNICTNIVREIKGQTECCTKIFSSKNEGL